jgi:hypothetical protein
MGNNVIFDNSIKNSDFNNTIDSKNDNKISFPNKDDDSNKTTTENNRLNKNIIYKVKNLDSSIVNPNTLVFDDKITQKNKNNTDSINQKQQKNQENIINKMNEMSKQYTGSVENTNNSRLIKVADQLINYKKSLKNLSNEEIEQFKNIITTFKETNSLSTEQMSELKNITSKIDDSNRNKELFNSLINISEQIKNGEDVFNDKYIYATKKVDRAISTLNSEIDKIPTEQRNGFTKSLGTLMRNYQKALDSGNEVQIVMYSSLLEKITNAVKEGKSGEDIEKLIAEYEELTKNLSSSSLSNKDKIDLIKNYIGEERFSFVKESIEKNKSNSTQGKKEDNSYTNQTQEKKDEDIIHEFVIGLGASIDDKGNIIPPKPLLDKKQREELINTTADEIIKTMKNLPDFKKAFYDFISANKDFIQIQKNLGNLINSSNILINSTNKVLDENIKQKIDELIKNAELLEEKLDLEIESSDSNIVTLLEKFRDIITTLDIDIRNNILKNIESILISQKNTEYIEDMKIRWKSFDKIKSEMNDLFEELKNNKLLT